MNTITINDDFDLWKITYSGQCFRPIRLGDGTYRFIIGSHVLYIRKAPDAEVSASGKLPDTSPSATASTSHSNVQAAISYEISCSLSEWQTIWIPYFDLEASYSTIRASLPASDQYIFNAATVGQGIRILRQEPFEMLISFIISQRKSIPAIRSSVEKLCKHFGSPISTLPRDLSETVDGCSGQHNDAEILYTFPTREELSRASQTELAECGLGYRLPYILDATERVMDGRLDLTALSTLPDDELLQRLKEVYGVGNKVANCIALFGYHRTALAPVDTWIARVIKEEYNGINPFPKYGDYAGLMQQYVFYCASNLIKLKDINQ